MRKTRSLSCKSLLLGTDEETLWREETAINFPFPSSEISVTEAMSVTTTFDVYCLPTEKLKRHQPEFTSRKWNCSDTRFFSSSYWLLKEIAEREVELDRDRMRERQRERERGNGREWYEDNPSTSELTREPSQFVEPRDILFGCQVLIETINCRKHVGTTILTAHNPFQLRVPYRITAEKLRSSNYLGKSHKVTAKHGN